MDSQPAGSTALAGPQHGLKQLGFVPTLGLGLLIAALWMATRPYQGVFHDSRFYTVEALNTLLPGRFSHDLYFQFGSQGRFTIFSLIYAPLISFLGLSAANIALTILAQCAWLGGLCYLAGVLFRDWKVASLAVVAAILLPSGLFLLPYGEPYVTPRSFSEALTFWALGSQWKGRPIRALALLGVSMLIHPLMTLPGLCVWFLYQAAQQRVLWVFAVGGFAAVLVLALAGLEPFSRLLLRFDPAWLEVIRTREDFCFVSLWGWDRWLPVFGCFALGLFEFTLATGSERRLLVPVFTVGAGGILLSLVGGDIFHNVLIFDIQTWRFIWLFTLVANLFAVNMLVRFAKARPSTSSLTLFLIGSALGLLVIAKFFESAAMGAVALLIVAVFAAFWEWVGKRPLPRVLRVPLALLAGCSLGALLIGAEYTFGRSNLSPTLFWEPLRQFILALCISVSILFFLFWPENPARERLYRSLFLVAAFGLAAIACWRWDQRTPWNRFVDEANPPSELTGILPGDAPIYWEGNVSAPWFLLKRASYFSCDQGTGTLFSRDTAIAYSARYADFQKLQTLDFRQYTFCPLTEPQRTTPLRRADLSALCLNAKELGALVLTERVADAPYRLWISPVSFDALQRSGGGVSQSFSADHFYIYTCSELR